MQLHVAKGGYEPIIFPILLGRGLYHVKNG